MKKQVIDWIRSWQTAHFEAGLDLYRQVRATYQGHTEPVEASESPENRRVLAIKLGNLLKTVDFSSRPAGVLDHNPQSAPESFRGSNQSYDHLPDNVDLTLHAKIALDIDSLITLRKAGHNALHTMSTDYDRRKKLEELEQLQERISYCRQLIRSIQKGEKVNYDAYIPAAEEDDFEVPDNPLALQKKYQLMLQKRSKRKARLAKLTEEDKEYHDVLHDWKHCDNVVTFLKAKLDEYKKPAA